MMVDEAVGDEPGLLDRFCGAALGVARVALVAASLALIWRVALPSSALHLSHTTQFTTEQGLDLYPIVMSIVHWGDVHTAGKKGRPLLHTHDLCGKDFDPVMVCSECGEPLVAKQVHVHRGPGAKSARHLPLDTDLPSARRVAKEKASA